MKLGILSLAKKLSLSAASLAVLSTSSLLGLHSAAHAAPPPEAYGRCLIFMTRHYRLIINTLRLSKILAGVIMLWCLN